MAVLSESQQRDYFASQSGAERPMSPLEFLQKSQVTSQQPPEPTLTPGVITSADGIDEVQQSDKTLANLTKPSLTKPTQETPKSTQQGGESGQDLSFLKDIFDQDATRGEQTLSPDQQRIRDAEIRAQEMQSELASMVKEVDSFKITDEQLNSQIQSITSRWDARIAEMENIGQRREKAFETLGYRTGGQWSGGVRGGVFGGVIAEEERQGVARIGELEAQKQQEITAAKQAAEDRNWKLYTAKVQAAQDAYTNQLTEIDNLNKAEVENRKQLMEESKDLRLEEKHMSDMEKSTIDSVSFGLMSMLTGDEATDMQMISEYAMFHRVNPSKLYSSVLAVKTKEERDNFTTLQGVARDYASYLKVNGLTQDQFSTEEFLNLQDPSYQFKAQQAQLNLEKTQVGIESDRANIDKTRQDIQKGGLEMQKLRQEIKKVEDEAGITDRDRKVLTKQTEALATINLLRTMKGKGGAIGAGFQKALGWIPGVPDEGIIPGTPAASYTAQVNRLKSLITVPQLEFMKGLGQMSERELMVIASAASAIDPAMEETQFDIEVNRIEKSLQDSVFRTKKKGEGYTDEEIDAYFDERDANQQAAGNVLGGGAASSGISGSTTPM